MYISIETNEPIDALARKLLQVILDESPSSGRSVTQADRAAERAATPATPATPDEPTEAPAEEEVPPKRRRRTKAEMAAARAAEAEASRMTSPAEEPSQPQDASSDVEVDEPEKGEEEEDDSLEYDEALRRAKEAVQSGKGSLVRKALKKTSASRVAELEGDDIRVFLDALGEE